MRSDLQKQTHDYLVVGGGLAGCCLTVQLLMRGQTVALIDLPHQNRSSAEAAGLFNPITNKVMNKTWQADELFSSLHTFYQQAESFLRARFFYPMPLYRPFGSVEEQNEWMARSVTPGVQPYIEKIFTSHREPHETQDPFGGILLKQCGYVDVNALMRAVRTILDRDGSYLEEPFDFDALDAPSARYKGLSVKKIVFCEGTAVRQNPHFRWLPINSLKGETLEVVVEKSLSAIYNRGVYTVPWNNQPRVYKVGATYQRNGANGPSTEGRQELIQKLDDLISLPYEIMAQGWGFRPTIIDRRPVLGQHPSLPNLMVFNGLGTKGVTLAPHFSGVLADHILVPAQIDAEVNITRFYPLYSKF